MRLSALLDGVDAAAVRAADDVEIAGIAHDSRRVRPGDLFFALAANGDARRHVAEALARGARGVVAVGDVDANGAAVVRTPSPRRLLGRLAARLAGDPSAKLTLVGVTGTNGKTTTVNMLRHVLDARATVESVTTKFDDNAATHVE